MILETAMTPALRAFWQNQLDQLRDDPGYEAAATHKARRNRQLAREAFDKGVMRYMTLSVMVRLALCVG